MKEKARRAAGFFSWGRWPAGSLAVAALLGVIACVAHGLLHLAAQLLAEPLGLLAVVARHLAGLLLHLAHRFLHAALGLVLVHPSLLAKRWFVEVRLGRWSSVRVRRMAVRGPTGPVENSRKILQVLDL